MKFNQIRTKMEKATMKATTLARLIEECDNHALTDYYYFQEVEPAFEKLSMNKALGFGPEYVEVKEGMYLIFYSDIFMDEYKGILDRIFGNVLEDYILYKNRYVVIIRIQD